MRALNRFLGVGPPRHRESMAELARRRAKKLTAEQRREIASMGGKSKTPPLDTIAENPALIDTLDHEAGRGNGAPRTIQRGPVEPGLEYGRR